jgi:predicted nuclease with TOPRIM domain
VKKEMADALLDFYNKILKPEFDDQKQQHAEHREQLSDLYGHLDSIYRRLQNIEDEHLAMNNRLTRIEDGMKLGALRHDQLGTRVKEIKNQLAALQSRLELVEHQLSLSAE